MCRWVHETICIRFHFFKDFKKELELQSAESYNKVEKALYDVYEENSATINEKLEELFAVLDRIGNVLYLDKTVLIIALGYRKT